MDKAEMLALVALKKSGTVDVSQAVAAKTAAQAAQEAAEIAQGKAEDAQEAAETAAASFTVDSAMSDSSTNPVQNKVIAEELNDLKSRINVNTSFAQWTKNTFDASGGLSNGNGAVSSRTDFDDSTAVSCEDGSRFIIAYFDAYGWYLGKVSANGSINKTSADWKFFTAKTTISDYAPTNATKFLICLLPTDSTTLTTDTVTQWANAHSGISYNRLTNMQQNIDGADSMLDHIADILDLAYDGNKFKTGFWANNTGEYNGSRTDYVCTIKMFPVSPGDTVVVKNIPFASGNGYFVQYNSDKEYINPNVFYSVANNQFTGVVASGVSYLHFDLSKGGDTLNPTDFANVSITINGVEVTKNAIARLEDEINSVISGNGFVTDGCLMKRPVTTKYLGAVTYSQSFCVYNGSYYSTDGDHIGVQNSSFTPQSSETIAVGHGNSFQLGSDGIAYISGWSDNNIYAVDLSTIEIDSTIALPTTGYTTSVIDDKNHIAYIFQRDSYPDTVENYNFIVYDYQNEQIMSTRVVNAFGAMQACDYYNGRIVVVWGLGTVSLPSGMAIYNTNGDIIAEFDLDIFRSSEPEGVCFDRDTGKLLISIGTAVYEIGY